MNSKREKQILSSIRETLTESMQLLKEVTSVNSVSKRRLREVLANADMHAFYVQRELINHTKDFKVGDEVTWVSPFNRHETKQGTIVHIFEKNKQPTEGLLKVFYGIDRSDRFWGKIARPFCVDRIVIKRLQSARFAIMSKTFAERILNKLED